MTSAVGDSANWHSAHRGYDACMRNIQGGYDYINKRITLDIDGTRVSIPVQVSGTKHAAVSRSEMTAKGLSADEIEFCVHILKKHRNNNGKSFLVSVGD
jgi:hypothetical protein